MSSKENVLEQNWDITGETLLKKTTLFWKLEVLINNLLLIIDFLPHITV